MNPVILWQMENFHICFPIVSWSVGEVAFFRLGYISGCLLHLCSPPVSGPPYFKTQARVRKTVQNKTE